MWGIWGLLGPVAAVPLRPLGLRLWVLRSPFYVRRRPSHRGDTNVKSVKRCIDVVRRATNLGASHASYGQRRARSDAGGERRKAPAARARLAASCRIGRRLDAIPLDGVLLHAACIWGPTLSPSRRGGRAPYLLHHMTRERTANPRRSGALMVCRARCLAGGERRKAPAARARHSTSCRIGHAGVATGTSRSSPSVCRMYAALRAQLSSGVSE